MATTKRARYRFRVKEGPAFTHEPREGVIELVDSVFITAEPCGNEPSEERPLQDPDSLSFDLELGTSLRRAEEIASFLNENLVSIAITRFGDAEDAARDVDQSERLRQIDVERFSGATGKLKERLAADDLPGAVEEVKAFESAFRYLIEDWSKPLAWDREILRKFGEREDYA